MRSILKRLASEPEPRRTGPEICFVGVDFGTARSGWAYCTSSSPDADVKLQYVYPYEENQAPKTPTVLLYERDRLGQWQPATWGMEAHKKYLNARGSSTQQLWRLTEFKLWLTENNPSWVKLPPDFPFDAVTVVSHYLSFLTDHILDNLRMKLGNEFRRENIRWCLTVPASCSDAAKAAFRTAAAMARMVDDPMHPNLTLAHEPEAAALTVSVHKQDMKFKEGEYFLIVDAGGGTVDITFHKVVKPKNGTRLVLAEATYRHGLYAGSVQINHLFHRYLVDVIGRDALLRWIRTHPAKWAVLEEKFESNKRGFTGVLDNYILNSVMLHRTLRDMMEPEALQRLRYCQDDDDDEIQIPFAVMKSCFDEPIDDIIGALHLVLSRVAQPPDQMLLVGGMGSSPYLHQRLTEEFVERTKTVRTVINSEHAYAAVVHGAVLHSRAPDTIYERRSPWTYGVQVMADWQADAPDREQAANGRPVTRKAFSHFITINDVVTKDYTVVKRYQGTYEGQRRIEFPIFATDRAIVKYTTDPGVFKVGTVVIPIKSHKSSVDVEFKFGLADIQVKAKETSTKNKVSVTLQFTDYQPARTAAPNFSLG